MLKLCIMLVVSCILGLMLILSKRVWCFYLSGCVVFLCWRFYEKGISAIFYIALGMLNPDGSRKYNKGD